MTNDKQAAQIVREYAETSADSATLIMQGYIKLFSEANPRFDESKFREACGDLTHLR